MENEPQKLKIAECLNLANSFLNRVETATHDEIINAFFQLALNCVHATCKPETDLETRQVLSIYEADLALRSTQLDLIDMIIEKAAAAEEEAAEAIKDEENPAQIIN